MAGFLDYTQEEIDAALEDAKKSSITKKGTICICGHPEGRHEEVIGQPGVYLCSAHKGGGCRCKEKRIVLWADNARVFLRKTKGAGAMHALAMGVESCKKADIETKWLIDLKCDKCGAENVGLSPACVTDRGMIVAGSAARSILLCRECRENS